MASGDDDDSLTFHQYLPCGCYQGPWLGTGTAGPPRCAQHQPQPSTTTTDPFPLERRLDGARRRLEATRERLRRFQERVQPSPPRTMFGNADPDTLQAFQEALRRAADRGGDTSSKVTIGINPPSLDALFQMMGTQIGKALGETAAGGDEKIAEHDCWQMAMQALSVLRAAVDRAQSVKEGK